MKFDGSNGTRPSAQARRYIYAVMASCLNTDIEDHEGWVLGGIEDECDVRRLKKETRKVVAELIRKSKA